MGDLTRNDLATDTIFSLSTFCTHDLSNYVTTLILHTIHNTNCGTQKIHFVTQLNIPSFLLWHAARHYNNDKFRYCIKDDDGCLSSSVST